MGHLNRIQWLTDLIHLEIVLWDHINDRLKEQHNLSLAFFEALYAIGDTAEATVRIGDIGRALHITQGATSKLVDRIEAADLIRREADADDRRASRIALTDRGRQALAAASETYEAELAKVLAPALSTEEQQQLHALVVRLLRATEPGDGV